MDSLFHGRLANRRDHARAWADSLLIDHAALRLVWANRHTVVPGVLYRSNHPPPGRLAREARRLGLRSIITLRGATRSGSDALSRAAAGRLGLALFDAPLSSGAAPDRARLLVLLEALETAPKPALVHCKSGADRAGFAAALFLLLQGVPTERAARQLSWRYGHLRHSRAGVLDAFLDLWRAQGEGQMTFRAWVETIYDPAALANRPRPSAIADVLHAKLLWRE